MKLGRYLSWGAGLAAVSVGARALQNVYRFRVREEHCGIPGLRSPLHLVQLSDLHYGLYLKDGSVRRWVETASALKPDLIVITGDFIQGRSTVDATPLASLLEPLTAPLGVWGVWGNHDHVWYTDEPQRLEQLLQRAGVRLLTNHGVRLREDLYLAGIDDEGTGRPDVAAALNGASRDAATILLCHQPASLERVPRWVSLVLAGHTHGGQLRLPAGPGLPYGWWRERPLTFVSSGLGVGLLPARLNCPAEIVSHRLTPVKS